MLWQTFLRNYSGTLGITVDKIALLLRQIGAEPAATDFVFWTREPLDHSE